LENKI